MSDIKVSESDIKNIVNDSEFYISTILEKCTIVACKLPNGFIIVESSACVDKANYDEKLGAEICRKKIIDKIWELEGYALQSFIGA